MEHAQLHINIISFIAIVAIKLNYDIILHSQLYIIATYMTIIIIELTVISL